ncbi:hypothetical protein [Streptomyces sp. NBC_01438]|uniref:hypothetical protein n=1 Tax=Streptomyces sp. NBC_01438 TaxID=2903866 RepID=UPI003252B619
MTLAHRLTASLGGLALALGGLFIIAPAAHADAAGCEQYVKSNSQNFSDPDDVESACTQGANGKYGLCLNLMEQAADVEYDVAARACQIARRH